MAVTDAVLAGAVAGCCARGLTAPLDVVKIRMQLQLEPITMTMAGQVCKCNDSINFVHLRSCIHLRSYMLLLHTNTYLCYMHEIR